MTLLAIGLSLFVGFVWLFFYLREDIHPEPRGLLLAVFASGIAFAFFAVALQVTIRPILANLQPNAPMNHGLPITLLSLTILACIEEVMKFAAAHVIVHKNREFNEPVDAMIYMVVAALGFATLENFGALSGNSGEPLLLGTVLETASLRFVGATLLHTLSSGIVGYYWAVSIREFFQARFLFIGIALATLLHVIFNYLILNYGNAFYPILLVTIAGFFVLSDFERLRRKTI